MQLPEWSKTVYPQPLLKFVEIWLEIPSYTTEMARLDVGPLINTMIKHMEDKMDGTLKQKMWIYSAHDTTISSLLKALQVFDPQIPPYCSATFLELKKRQEEYYVELYYRNSTATQEPHLLQIPGCEPSCPIQEFKRLTEQLIPLIWEEECKLVGGSVSG
jgi:lysosomal acid phosphatase